MDARRASRAEHVPLFESVGEKLKREIAGGRFAGADLLPGERELSQMLHVSRTTLRRAIAGLVDEGVLVAPPWRGNFCPPQSAPCRAGSLAPDELHRGYAAPRPRRLVPGHQRGTFLPTPEESMMLDISLSETVFRLGRLRLADGVPMAFERATVPLRFLGGSEPVVESLYAALEAHRLSAGACAFSGSAPW